MKQHFVPATYLRAWCDTASPANYQPYVWVFPKNGGEAKNRAPEKIFWETDFYTIKRTDGERDLVIETSLSQLENQFTTIRQRTISKNKPLSSQEKNVLYTFVAAMFARTKSQRDHIRGQGQEMLDIGNRMAKWAENATPKERKQLSLSFGPRQEPSFSLDDIRNVVENPMRSYLADAITLIAPALSKMSYAILCSSDTSTFITSDTPCVWFDPDLFQNPSPFGAGGLISPSIEISLPLSPTQLIFFGRKLIFDGLYIPFKADNPLIETINRRTWEYADEYFIANQNSTNFSWLNPKRG